MGARTVWLSVFRPREVARDPKSWALILRTGWVLVVVRWAYYSVLFQFRDYRGRWTPFAPPPLGLSIDSYAMLQRWLALPFGVVLLTLLALVLVAGARAYGYQLSVRGALGVLGVAFFIPFVLVQPLDQLLIALIGWKMVPVTVIHTAVLLWESWAAMQMLSVHARLDRLKVLGGMLALCAVWIGVAGALWR